MKTKRLGGSWGGSWPLAAAMTAQFAAGGAVIPFITLLFRDRGLSFGQVSLVFAASSATLLVFPFLWGMLADRFIPLNRLFTLLNAVACVSLGFLAVQQHFTGLLIAYTCYFACFNPTLYLLNALSFHHLPNPREQFGILRAWGSLGWIIPFLPISLWLARGDNQADLTFVLYLGMGCCAAMTILSFWLPHTPPGAQATPPLRPGTRLQKPADTAAEASPTAETSVSLVADASYGTAIRCLLLNPNYLVLLFSMFLMAGSFSLLIYYSPPVLQEIGVPRVWIGPIQGIAVVFEIILFQWQPGLIRRWDYTAVILAGCIALAVRHLLFGMVDNAWALSLSYLLAGAVIVFYHQGVSLLVNSMATHQVRATAQTLLLFFGQGMGPLFANAVAGRLASQAGNSLRPVFYFAAALSALAALVIVVRGSRLNSQVRCSAVPTR